LTFLFFYDTIDVFRKRFLVCLHGGGGNMDTPAGPDRTYGKLSGNKKIIEE
jgi:hypothetical protein